MIEPFPDTVDELRTLAALAGMREAGRRDRMLAAACQCLLAKDAHLGAVAVSPCPRQRRRAEMLAKEAELLAVAWTAAAHRRLPQLSNAKALARGFRACLEAAR